MMAPPVRAIADLPDTCQLRILSLLERSKQPSTPFAKNEKRNDTALVGASISVTTSCSRLRDEGVVKTAMKNLAERGFAVIETAVEQDLVSDIGRRPRTVHNQCEQARTANKQSVMSKALSGSSTF
jgi:hypothetical protein